MTEFKYYRFISAGEGTREQRLVMNTITEGHWANYCEVKSSHDYQRLWNGLTEPILQNMALYFDIETLTASEIYRCMKVLCGIYAHKPEVMHNIKKIFDTGMYGIDGQGHIFELNLDLINDQLIPKYFKKSCAMNCKSLL